MAKEFTTNQCGFAGAAGLFGGLNAKVSPSTGPGGEWRQRWPGTWGTVLRRTQQCQQSVRSSAVDSDRLQETRGRDLMEVVLIVGLLAEIDYLMRSVGEWVRNFPRLECRTFLHFGVVTIGKNESLGFSK